MWEENQRLQTHQQRDFESMTTNYIFSWTDVLITAVIIYRFYIHWINDSTGINYK